MAVLDAYRRVEIEPGRLAGAAGGIALGRTTRMSCGIADCRNPMFAKPMRCAAMFGTICSPAMDTRRRAGNWTRLTPNDGSAKSISQQDRLFQPLRKPSELDQPGSAILRFRREMTYDPVPALRALRVPALFLFGADDRLIPVEKSAMVIRDTLTQSGHADFTILVLDHDDHGMRVTTGDNGGAIDPRYLDTMRKCLAKRVHIVP